MLRYISAMVQCSWSCGEGNIHLNKTNWPGYMYVDYYMCATYKQCSILTLYITVQVCTRNLIHAQGKTLVTCQTIAPPCQCQWWRRALPLSAFSAAGHSPLGNAMCVGERGLVLYKQGINITLLMDPRMAALILRVTAIVSKDSYLKPCNLIHTTFLQILSSHLLINEVFAELEQSFQERHNSKVFCLHTNHYTHCTHNWNQGDYNKQSLYSTSAKQFDWDWPFNKHSGVHRTESFGHSMQ